MTTATATPTDERIATRRAELMKQRATRKDPDDLMLSPNERRAYVAETAKIDAETAAFNAVVEKWAAVPTPDADTKWLAHLTAWRDTISTERLTIKSPMRDRAVQERAQRLEWTIKLIDHGLGISSLGIVTLALSPIGPLMQAAGYETQGEALRGPRGFRGGIEEVEYRIKTLTKQRTAAEAALDLALEDDTARAKRESESQAYRDALNSMDIRNGSTGLVAYDKDTGDPLAVADMTEPQRKAFEQADARERAYRQSVIDRQLGRG